MNNNTLETSNQSINQQSRIEYIDALRGFTMIMVVFNHVANFVWGIVGKGIPSVHEYLIQVRMPMFFFISGFVLYKAGIVWDKKHVVEFLCKKFMVQIIPTLIFLALYVHVMGLNFIDALYSPSKEGYWFTYILFTYFMIYSITQYCIRKYAYLFMVFIGIVFLPIAYPLVMNNIPIPELLKGLLSLEFMCYFFFFVLGSIVRKHFKQVERWLDSRWLLLCCIVTYFILNIYRDILPGNGYGPIGGFLVGQALTLSGLTILFAFFRTNKEQFSKNRWIGHSLQYIGRRTLDVYLLHYFFLPVQLGSLMPFFADTPMPIIEAVCSFAIAILVVGSTLLISNIIRLSPIGAHYLFGVKL